MDTLTELRQLADDLTELGDSATAALVRQAIDRFSARKFEAGERLLQERRKRLIGEPMAGTDRGWISRDQPFQTASQSGNLLSPAVR